MKKMRWKRFAAFALAVMLFAGAVPAAAPGTGLRIGGIRVF